MLLYPRVRNGVHVNENGIVGYTLRSARVHESILIGLSVATLQRQCPVLSSINVLFCPTYVRNRSMLFMSWTLQLSLTSSFTHGHQTSSRYLWSSPYTRLIIKESTDSKMVTIKNENPKWPKYSRSFSVNPRGFSSKAGPSTMWKANTLTLTAASVRQMMVASMSLGAPSTTSIIRPIKIYVGSPRLIFRFFSNWFVDPTFQIMGSGVLVRPIISVARQPAE